MPSLRNLQRLAGEALPAVVKVSSGSRPSDAPPPVSKEGRNRMRRRGGKRRHVHEFASNKVSGWWEKGRGRLGEPPPRRFLVTLLSANLLVVLPTHPGRVPLGPIIPRDVGFAFEDVDDRSYGACGGGCKTHRQLDWTEEERVHRAGLSSGSEEACRWHFSPRPKVLWHVFERNASCRV